MEPNFESPIPTDLDYYALFDAAPTPYLVLAGDLRIVSANQAYLQATKTVREQIVGRNLFDVFPDNPADPVASGVATLRASLQRVLQNKRADTMAIQKYDIPVSGVDGIHFEERFWSPINTPLLNAEGAVTHIIHRVEDVTDFVRTRDRTACMASTIDDQAAEIEIANRRLREANETLEQRVTARTEAQRLTEEKLRASELRFRLMANSIPQILWIIDDSGRGVYFNDQWFAYTGVALDSIEPMHVSDEFVHPYDRELTMRAWELAYKGETNFSVEHRLRSASGEYRWFLVRAEAYRDPQSGQIVMWFGTSTDVHDRKLAEAAISEREQLLRLAIDAADVGEWDVDMTTGAMFWPARVKAMFGISADRPVVLADYYEGVHPHDREHTLASFAATADPQLRTQYDAEYRTIGKEDQVIRWIAAKGRGVFNDSGECTRIIGTAIDITERKANEEALRGSEERLRQADRRKDEFLAMLAHELRNPLAPISSAAALLKLPNLPPQRVYATADIIGRQVNHMTGLVDDLLDVSRVTTGFVSLAMENVDIRDVIADAVEQVRPLIESRRHDLSVQMGAAPADVLGDYKRLVQVLSNLLNNAAKYTPEGGKLLVQLDTGDEKVVIRLSDNGNGISEELLPRVFELFSQAERTSDRSQGGLGLGLALVKSLVELHGGHVSAKSDGPGTGSQFKLILPLRSRPDGEPATATDLWQQRQPIPTSPRLLVVDDNVDAAQMLCMFLEAKGYRVVVEHDPYKAITRATHEAFDAYLLDIGLPGMDGNELARHLRELPNADAAMMVAITGYGNQYDRRTSMAAGFDEYVVKPADPGEILRLLNKIAKTVP